MRRIRQFQNFLLYDEDTIKQHLRDMKSKVEVGFINGMRAARNRDLLKNIENYEKFILRKIDFVVYLGEKDNMVDITTS